MNRPAGEIEIDIEMQGEMMIGGVRIEEEILPIIEDVVAIKEMKKIINQKKSKKRKKRKKKRCQKTLRKHRECLMKSSKNFRRRKINLDNFQ